MPVVHFLNEAISVEVPEGTSLYDAAAKAGVNLFIGFTKSYHCAGKGRCLGSGCRVWVTADDPAALSAMDSLKEKLRRLRGTQRLACMVRVHGDCEVRTMSAAVQIAEDATWEPDERHYAWHDRLAVVEKKKKTTKAAAPPAPRRKSTELGVGPVGLPPAPAGQQVVVAAAQGEARPRLPGVAEPPESPESPEPPARMAAGTTAPLPVGTPETPARATGRATAKLGAGVTPEQDAMIRVQQAVAKAKTKVNMVGRTIDGRYHILEELGAGGMGRVYLAEHVHIRRHVAVKLLHPVLTQFEEVSARFAREAVAIGRINHPNCVGVSDFGALDDGSLYLVMDYLQGTSLGELMEEEGALAPARVLRIGRHILRGLGHAHDVGIVHRDVKPDNIVLIEHDGDPELAKILDFGIAKIIGRAERDTGLRPLTQTGMAFGTPTYMSPEQAAGDPVDGRSDLYSLSVVLYEMLAGRPPFVAEDKLEVLGMHRAREVPPIADVEIPADVERVIRRGLEKRPGDRYPNAAAYIEAIDACLARLSS